MREFFTYLPWYRVQAVQLDALSFFVFGNLHCTVYTVQYSTMSIGSMTFEHMIYVDLTKRRDLVLHFSHPPSKF